MNVKVKTVEFTNGVCASREKGLVGAERVRRMAEADSLSQAFDILRESGFGGELNVNYSEFDRLIEEEETLLCEFVKEYAPNKEILAFCLAERDFYNAEVIVKCNHLKCEYNNLITASGLVDISDLQSLIEEENDGKLPKELVLAVKQSKQALSEGKGGLDVGAIFARAKYDYLKRCVKTGYLKKILLKCIDGVNLCTLLRAGNLELANKQLLDGGSLTQKQMNAIVSLDEDAVGQEFATHYLKNVAILGVKAIKNGKPLVDVERQISSIGADRMEEGKYTEQSGTAPFIRYYYKRKNEIACVRTVLTGKANSLDTEEIKRRLITV